MNAFYRYQRQPTPDISILDRLTEAEVRQWMVAKLAQLQTRAFPAHVLEVTSWFRDYKDDSHFDIGWNIHAAGECAMADTLDHCVSAIKEQLSGDPESKAAEKRREAKRLLAEAEAFDAVAQEAVRAA